MKTQEFNKLTKEIFIKCKKHLDTKGPDYSGLEDRLSNFKIDAKELDIEPRKALWILAAKHLKAIKQYVRTGKLLGEPIEEKLIDLINYSILLIALERDLRKEK